MIFFRHRIFSPPAAPPNLPPLFVSPGLFFFFGSKTPHILYPRQSCGFFLHILPLSFSFNTSSSVGSPFSCSLGGFRSVSPFDCLFRTRWSLVPSFDPVNPFGSLSFSRPFFSVTNVFLFVDRCFNSLAVLFPTDLFLFFFLDFLLFHFSPCDLSSVTFFDPRGSSSALVFLFGKHFHNPVLFGCAFFYLVRKSWTLFFWRLLRFFFGLRCCLFFCANSSILTLPLDVFSLFIFPFDSPPPPLVQPLTFPVFFFCLWIPGRFFFPMSCVASSLFFVVLLPNVTFFIGDLPVHLLFPPLNKFLEVLCPFWVSTTVFVLFGATTQ